MRASAGSVMHNFIASLLPGLTYPILTHLRQDGITHDSRPLRAPTLVSYFNPTSK